MGFLQAMKYRNTRTINKEGGNCLMFLLMLPIKIAIIWPWKLLFHIISLPFKWIIKLFMSK